MFSNQTCPIDVDTGEYKNEFVEVKEEPQILTYESFKKFPKVLTTYRIPQLKQVAKYYRLHVSGTKAVLIARIQG